MTWPGVTFSTAAWWALTPLTCTGLYVCMPTTWWLYKAPARSSQANRLAAPCLGTAPVASSSCCLSAPLEYSPAMLQTRPGNSAATARLGQPQWQVVEQWSPPPLRSPSLCVCAARKLCCRGKLRCRSMRIKTPCDDSIRGRQSTHSPWSSSAFACSPYSSPMGPTISSCATWLPLRMSRAARAIRSQLQQEGKGLAKWRHSCSAPYKGRLATHKQAARCSPLLVRDAAHEGAQLELSAHLRAAGGQQIKAAGVAGQQWPPVL